VVLILSVRVHWIRKTASEIHHSPDRLSCNSQSFCSLNTKQNVGIIIINNNNNNKRWKEGTIVAVFIRINIINAYSVDSDTGNLSLIDVVVVVNIGGSCLCRQPCRWT
jgi:hypothetical protein